MKITAKGRYAVAAVAYIAEEKDKLKPVTATAISKNLKISKTYLGQILSILKNAGILKSVKGASGGFVLAKAPEQISLYTILSETELNLFETREYFPEYIRSETDRYLSEYVLNKLENVMYDYLKSFSVSDILESKEVSVSAAV